MHLEAIGLTCALLQVWNVCLRHWKQRSSFADPIDPDVAGRPVAELVVIAVVLIPKHDAREAGLLIGGHIDHGRIDANCDVLIVVGLTHGPTARARLRLDHQCPIVDGEAVAGLAPTGIKGLELILENDLAVSSGVRSSCRQRTAAKRDCASDQNSAECHVVLPLSRAATWKIPSLGR